VRGEDPALRGLNAQLEAALQGLEEALVLHADLPLATADALTELLAAAQRAPSVTLVESSDGGTNAMVLRPPGSFRLAYGRDSCARHVRSARAAHLHAGLVDSPALRLDLDTAPDLAALLATSAGRASPAGRFLLAIGVEERLRGGLP
jgi:2-phospho-L-lactate guanylyltransferase